MICHLVFEHEYTQLFNDFIDSCFEINNHVFIVYGHSSIGFNKEFNFKNSQYLQLNDDRCLTALKSASAIIVHGLFYQQVIDLLVTHKELLTKTAWMLWGGDLYSYRHAGTEMHSEDFENKRREVISDLRWIICPVVEDFELACLVYNSRAEYLYGFYSMTIDFDYLDTIRLLSETSGPVRILVGNSATASNQHEEVLHVLSRFKDEKIQIYCPLTYGDEEYANRVVQLGNFLYGNKFHPIVEAMPFNQYTEFLASIDVGIMNHNRQQGLGTIVILIYLGKKIYMRTDISSYAELSRRGLKLFDISDLNTDSMHTFASYNDSVKTSNIDAIRREYSREACYTALSKVFRIIETGGYMNNENVAKNIATSLKNRYFPGTEFVGPYEAAGQIASVCEEQWLWANREYICGSVLDMSTPRYWHEFIYQLNSVDKVLISNLDASDIFKGGKTSRPDIVGDFCESQMLPDNSVDTILCLSILEHCEDMFAMCSNLSKILKPGGHIFFYTPFAYIDGHLTPDYWRIGRDGYRLLAKKAGLEIIQERNFGDMGKYLLNDFGIDGSANQNHRGIPNAVTVICRKPVYPIRLQQQRSCDYQSIQSIMSQSQIKLYAGDVPALPEYAGWIGLSLTQHNDRHIIHDIITPLPFPNDSVDVFQAEDVIEHIQYDILAPVINEIYRVLKPGALFRLSVPDYGCDVLRERSVKDVHGNIVFDPGGGGTPEDPGHVWFPRIESVYRLLEKTRFHTEGTMHFLHYWDMGRPTFVARPIDYSKGFIKRTPDNDERVKNPYRPMSIVVDLYKGA